MIYTCTINPSLDYYIIMDQDFIEGRDNRSSYERFEAGGKGINVSIALHKIGIPSTALGFLGGFVKDYYLSFLKTYHLIEPLFTSIKDNTRINIKLSDTIETGINAKGPKISDEEFMRFVKRFNYLYDDDIFVLSGNVQEELIDKIVKLIHDIAEKGIKIVLDSNFEVIERCLDINPFLVHLNICDYDDEKIKDIKEEFLIKGAKNILCSCPHHKQYLLSKEFSYYYFDDSLNLDTTGYADRLLAGYLFGVLRGANDYEAFRYACSLAALSGDVDYEKEIENKYKNIEVYSL